MPTNEPFAVKPSRVEELLMQIRDAVEQGGGGGGGGDATLAARVTELENWVTDNEALDTAQSTAIDENVTDISDIKERLDALEYKDIKINSFTISPSTCEIGSSQTINLAWTLNKTATNQTGWATPAQLQAGGYKIINSNEDWYFLYASENNPTVADILAIDVHKFKDGSTIPDIEGAKMCFWSGDADNGDMGDGKISDMCDLVEAFGTVLANK